MHDKSAVPKNKNPEKEIAYCSTCGDQLEDFCFSPQAEDQKYLEQRKHWCKTQGRFHGDECAKQFIARDIPPEIVQDDE